MVERYQRVGTHLSVLRSSAPDPTLVSYLSWLLARARSKATRSGPVNWAGVGRFVTASFPAALYRLRWWWIVSAAANVVVAFAVGWWFLANPGFESSLLSPAEIERLVSSDFESYYSQHAASSFAARVWTNNAWVSALCIAFGVLGFPVVLLLWRNIMNVALVGAIMVRHDRGGLFFGLILPHGLLELTAVFVAAAVGLRLFWSWVEPGSRSRLAAFAHEGRVAAGVALGLAGVLAVSGAIEAFVTPSSLPTWARIAIGVAAEVAFCLYVFILGRRAHEQGDSGDASGAVLADQLPSRG